MPLYRRLTSVSCGLLVGCALSAWATEPAPPRPKATEVHRERPDMPYLPPEPTTGARPKAAPVVRGDFVSVQVNVDALGANIPHDAANEPSLAIDPTAPNRMAIGWRQFDNVASNYRQAGWAWSVDGGRSWTFPGSIDTGAFRSDPVLDADSDGNFLYYSLTVEGENMPCDFFPSTDQGATWGGAVRSFGGDKEWFVVDRTGGIGDGNVYAFWTTIEGNCCGNRTFTRSTDGGVTFAEPVEVTPHPIWGTLALGPDGELYLAGNVDYLLDFFVVLRSDDAQDPSVWPPTFTSSLVNMGGAQGFSGEPNPAGLVGQVWVAADSSTGPTRGNVYVLCSVDPPGDDPMDVHFVRSEDGGTTWSAPVALHTDDRNAWQWFGTMSVAPDGRIDAVWVESVNFNLSSLGELYYTWSDDAGVTWAQPVSVTPQFDSHVGWPAQQKLGDYYQMMSDAVGADLAYAATFNGEQDVFYLRLGDRDCNRNGVGDSLDLSSGTSADCDSNQIPDSCQIAAAPALDSDHDGVIDSCSDRDRVPRHPGGRLTP